MCDILVPSICLIEKLYKEIISSLIPARVAIIGEITKTIGPANQASGAQTITLGGRKSRIKSLLSFDVFIPSTAPGQKVQTSPDSPSKLIFNLKKFRKESTLMASSTGGETQQIDNNLDGFFSTWTSPAQVSFAK